MDSQSTNLLKIHGRLIEIQPRRMTPGGIPVVAGVVEHHSRQDEAGTERVVTVSLPFVAVGALSTLLGEKLLGSMVDATGFVAAKGLKSRQIVLHVTDIRFVEGMNDGFQTEAS